MRKTIVRWTVGDVSDQGLACLRLSVRKFIEIYGREHFRYFVCHNGISEKKLDWLNGAIELLDQEKFTDTLPIPPSGVSWKLYPPRIDLDAREVFIDNDLVLYKKIDLERMSNGCFISEAIRRVYGSFDTKIQSFVNMNSGFFGLSPGFDFQSELSRTINEFNIDWRSSYFEEQGAVAYILHKKPHWIAMMNEITVVNPDQFERGCLKSKFGAHFIGLNSGRHEHWKFWRGNYKML